MKTLVVCRTMKDFALAKPGVVVASDDADVHLTGAQRGLHVDYLERTESYLAVREDVLALIDGLNRELAAATGEPLLFFERHVEGGLTSQRVQDAVLLIRAAQRLLDEHRPDRIIIRRRVTTQFEDDVLIATARAAGVKVVEHVRAAGWLKVYARGERALPWRLLWLRFWLQMLRNIAGGRRRGGAQGAIVFQIESRENKHVQNIVPVMRAFEARGAGAVALCWRFPAVAEALIAEGCAAENLEAWIRGGDGPSILRRWLRTMRRLGAISRIEQVYRGVDIIPLLRNSIEYLAGAQLPQRIALEVASRRYLAERRPVAIKTWGDALHEYGAIFTAAARELDPPPLTFYYTQGANIPIPHSAADLYLAAGENERADWVGAGVPPSRIVVTGAPRYDSAAMREGKAKETARTALGVSAGPGPVVLYCADSPLRGGTSVWEHVTVATALVDWFARGGKGTLLIKPHPSDATVFLPRLRAARPSPYVRWIEKTALPYEAISASDAVLLKVSTVGFEAMLLDRPVITLALDRERRFQDIFGPGAEKLSTLEELFALLERLQDQVVLEAWSSERVATSREFLPGQFSFAPGASDRIADVVLRRVGSGSAIGGAQ